MSDNYLRTPRPLKWFPFLFLFYVFLEPALAARVFYVDQSATQTGHPADGSKSYPFITIEKAVTGIMPGDTLVIKDGIYREAILLPERNWSEKIKTLIVASKPGGVTIKGSNIVRGWKKAGRNIYTKYNWQINSQQIFLDGAPLKQIGGTVFKGYPDNRKHPFHAYLGKSTIWPGRMENNIATAPYNSFYYDQERRVLLIKVPDINDITRHTIEVSVRPHLLYGRYTHGVTIKGIHFKHANTSDTSRAGAVTLRGNNITLDNIQITKVDSVGLNLSGNNNIVRNSVMNYCGQLGMKVRGKNNTLANNETSYNNTRGFNKWWEAGGAKFVGEYGLQNSTLLGHKSYFNRGDGIWFDWGNNNIEIKNNISAYNEGFGIHFEASQYGYIHDNIVFANLQRGIYLPHSSHSFVYNNLVALNKMEGIVVVDEKRRDKKGILDLEPKNNRIFGNTVAWNGKKYCSVVVPASQLENRSNYNLYISDGIIPCFTVGRSGSFFNKKIFGLHLWRRSTQQDTNSWSTDIPVSNNILMAIEKKGLSIPWKQLNLLSKQYQIPRKIYLSLPEALQSSALNNSNPGPKDYN